MIWGVEFTESRLASLVCRQAFEQGLMIETSGANDQVAKLLPPLTISKADLESGLSILRQAIRSVFERELRLKIRPMSSPPAETSCVPDKTMNP
jgi:diaminobutyrate-2-oxoglutarate transaminase